MNTKMLQAAMGAVVLVGLSVSPAMADFAYDLRFAAANPGYLDSKNLSLAAAGGATTFTLELWGRVTGADLDPTNDGLVFGNVSIQSTQIHNGAILGNSSYVAGVTGVTLTPNFADATLSHPGGAKALSGDNIQDWGSMAEWRGFGPAPAELITWFVDWHNPAFNNSLGLPRIKGAASIPGDPHTTEWELATVTITVPAGSVSTDLSGVTQFLPVLANFPIDSGAAGQVVTYLQDDSRIDGPYTSKNVASTSATAPGTPVNFLTSVPLPSAAWAGLALLSGMGVARCCRRKRTAT